MTRMHHIAVCLGDAVQPMGRENAADARRVGLLHVVDADHERDRKVPLKSNGREERVLRATRTAPLAEHQAVVGPVRIPPVWKLVQKLGGAPKRAASEPQEGLRMRASSSERGVG